MARSTAGTWPPSPDHAHGPRPLRHLRGAAEILAANYVGAARRVGEGQAALLMALSAYTTGSYDRGFGNGYVARYAAGYAVPALSGAAPALSRTLRNIADAAKAMRAARPNPLTADTAVAWGPGSPDEEAE